MNPGFHKSTKTLVVSYRGIRRSIGILGMLLPVALGPIGVFVFGIEIQDNMSSYYHTALRDVFVGTVCAIGVFLFCYEGYDPVEYWTAKFGCASAIGIALLPIDANVAPPYQATLRGHLHTLSGGVFFMTLAVYSLVHFPRSRPGDPEPAAHEKLRNFIYRTSGVVIVIVMLTMGAHLFLLSPELRTLMDDYNLLFWMEWVAVWAFSAAWLTKGRAIVAEMAVHLMALPGQFVRKGKSDDSMR